MATKKKTTKTYEDSSGKVFSTQAEAAASNSSMGTNPKNTSTYGKVGNLASSTFQEQTDPLQYGAGGRGEYPENAAITEEAGSLGVPTSEAPDYQYSKGGGAGVPEYIIPMGQYKGMTASSARDLQAKQAGQLSSLTSANFSDTLNGIKNAAKNFQLKLDSNINDPFSGKGTKEDNTTAILAGATSDFANSFNSVEDFNTMYQQNPDIQKSLDSYIKAGGSLTDIQSKIQAKATPALNTQTTSDYMSSLNGGLVDGTPEAIKAEQTMFVQGELAKQEIARQYNMSNEVQKLYFGDDKTIGLLEQNKNIADKKLELIQVQIDNAEADAKAQANYEIEKNNAEVEIAKSTLEQNRLNAKNYITGMLAKLGALQTTGAAPLAIASLDQKYQQQKQELDTKLYYANQKIRINLKKDVNDIETKAEDARITIQEDLSKDQETAFKEIMKAQQAAEKEIYGITKGYAKDFQTTKAKYEAETKSNNDKYISSFMTLAGKGIDINRISSLITPTGRINTSALTSSDLKKSTKTTGTSTRFDSKATQTFFNDLPVDFRNQWNTNYPTWEGTGVATKEALKADYLEWLKNNPGGKKAKVSDDEDLFD